MSAPSSTQFRFHPRALMIGEIARDRRVTGPEAIGGVISITTLPGDEMDTHHGAALEYGRRDTRRGAHSLGQSGECHALAMTLQHASADRSSVADEADGNR